MTLADFIKMCREADHPKGEQTLDLDTTKIKFYTGMGNRTYVLSTYWDGKKNTIIIDVGDER